MKNAPSKRPPERIFLRESAKPVPKTPNQTVAVTIYVSGILM